MDNIIMPADGAAEQPVAVSGLKDAHKIRVVIFVNNRLAHVPLTEILKLAQAGGKQPSENAAKDSAAAKGKSG